MRKTLTLLASLRLTLIILILLIIGVLATYDEEVHTTWTLVTPLVLFAVNLFAAILVSPAFRRSPGLLVFHLALLAILLLAAAGRLTYLNGHAYVAVGQEFTGDTDQQDAGPWHFGNLEDVRFVNEGFTIGYSPGLRRDKTHNRVSWVDEEGRQHTAVIGDNTPLKINGYSFYTTFNKGFAPIFLWQPSSESTPIFGSVRLPSYPLNDYRQAARWTVPGVEETFWVMLEIEEEILPEDEPSFFRAPEAHHIIIRQGDSRRTLKPGEGLDTAGGRLTYQGLTTYMGYSVHYDWTIHWLFASAFIGISGLGWHYWSSYRRRPWRPRY